MKKSSEVFAVRRPASLVCIWLTGGANQTTLVCRWIPADVNMASATSTPSTSEEAGRLRLCA